MTLWDGSRGATRYLGFRSTSLDPRGQAGWIAVVIRLVVEWEVIILAGKGRYFDTKTLNLLSSHSPVIQLLLTPSQVTLSSTSHITQLLSFNPLLPHFSFFFSPTILFLLLRLSHLFLFCLRWTDNSYMPLHLYFHLFIYLFSFRRSSISFSLSYYTSPSSFHFLLLSLNQLLALSQFPPICNCTADFFPPFLLHSFTALPL